MKSRGTRRGFTIVELLTVMSIIILLIAMLVPALNSVRRFSKVVVQTGQFNDIRSALEMYYGDFDEYPDSDRLDIVDERYCGAMKLCEAVKGQDGLGLHSASRMTYLGTRDGTSGTEDLYPPEPTPWNAAYRNNLSQRTLYLESDNIEICPIYYLYLDISVGFIRVSP